ncbi:MAG TPA: glutamate--tRNA ligase [Longimicrobiales bacterium]|nr:glutamate--tRNA ligase [Longimicrobiales bacterium]
MTDAPSSLRVAREETIDALCADFARDGLGMAELERRLARAREARTREELRALLADLSVPAAPAPAPIPSRGTGPVEPADATRVTTSARGRKEEIRASPMSGAPRVRFAPSPTGFLHVGGARTALFNWLFARHHGGTFVLRIEDTDRDRSSAAMTEAILDGMRWLGLDWDEGPVHQADGVERHRRDALRLLEEGEAYRCFCAPVSLEAKRQAAEGEKLAYRYDRHCLTAIPPGDSERRAADGEPFTVRFRVPEGETTWDDAVHDRISFSNADIEDFIVLRTDGTPIYNMAVVSDDHEMRVTHVIRGDDHLSNTPKQILLYRALGWELPTFAHVPMILGSDGRRLSKRHGATAVGQYREQGILAPALVNFLALLGWSPGDDTEVMAVAELVRRFSLEGINKKSAVFDTEKLAWLNGQYLAAMPAESLASLVADRVIADGLASGESLAEHRSWFLGMIELLKVRSRTLGDLVRQARPYLTDDLVFDEDAVAQHWGKKSGEVAGRMQRLRDVLAATEPWAEQPLEEALRSLGEELGVGAGKLIHPLRVAVTGQAASPGIFEVLVLLGRERTLARVDAALPRIEALAGAGAG